MLVKQAKRLQSPCLLVTNHEAQHFPNVYLSAQPNEPPVILQFDRILADVPCSGDGTPRKNINLWKNWNLNHAYGLHKIQLSILERACELLKVGGRVVYSTCSLNPIENEAVVAEMIQKSNGSIRIVDVSKELPALKRRPGVTSWKWISKDGSTYSNMDEAPEHLKKYMLSSHFPPADAASLGLEQCLRIYPHLQDTGGFFVAVLEKVAPFGRADKKMVPRENINDENTKLEEDNDGTPESEAKRQKLEIAEEELQIAGAEEKEKTSMGEIVWSSKTESPFIVLDPECKTIMEARYFYIIYYSRWYSKNGF